MLCLKDNMADVAFMKSIDLDYLTTSKYGNAPQYQPDVSFICDSFETTVSPTKDL